MSFFWKVSIGVILTTIIVFVIIVFGVFNKMLSVSELRVRSQDSLTEKVAKANDWLNKLQKENKFNGAVLLIKNDSVILKNTYGFTDYLQNKRLTNNSSFRLASVSKQFTAVGIMLLKGKGLLSFDDLVYKYLSNFPYKNVSIRHLLNHTSGIPDTYMGYSEKYKEDIGKVLTITKMVELYSKENLSLDNEPNEVYKYNNTGYVLLAAIIEKISTESFENFMKKELFEKLKMDNTRVWNLASNNLKFKTKIDSYENVLGNIKELKPSVLDGVAGDGAVFSSINDFVVWNQFWYKNNLLSEKIMKEAFVKPVLNNGKESDYGFGWIITNNKAHWHNGYWLGARTIIIRNEILKNCMVILDNSSSFCVDKIVKELVNVLK